MATTKSATIEENLATAGNPAAVPCPPAPAPLSIMGVGVMPFESYAQAVAHIESLLGADRKCFCVAVNPEKIHRAMNDPRLMAALSQADVGLCDGIGVSVAARLLHRQSIRRCTGCDLFFHLIARAAEKGWRVFLLGASPESNERACSVLQGQYAGLQIVGHQDGYFQDSDQVVRRINDSQAQMLFVALGSPKQEIWITEHRDAIRAPFCMGVGGTFDVASGMAKRAPKVFQRTGAEYLFQLVTRPGWSTKVRWKRTLARLLFLLAVARAAWAGPPEKYVRDAS
jgi:N-acetylglucosaminyldiphosphoundecaprenol N-acetyl-beta-D-mannosaminyltransferase